MCKYCKWCWCIECEHKIHKHTTRKPVHRTESHKQDIYINIIIWLVVFCLWWIMYDNVQNSSNITNSYNTNSYNTNYNSDSQTLPATGI